MLPESVAWRQKEQFSDGVGYSWIDTLKEITTAAVSDEQMENAAGRFPINTPQIKKNIITAVSLKNISPAKVQHAVYPVFQRSLLYSRSAGMGYRLQEPE